MIPAVEFDAEGLVARAARASLAALRRAGAYIRAVARRKVVETFRHSRLNELTAVCDLPDGGFLACVSPGGYGKTNDIEVAAFSSDRNLRRTWTLSGLFNSRSMWLLLNGELGIT